MSAVAIYDGRCSICRFFAGVLRRGISPNRIDVVRCGSGIQRKLAASVPYAQCNEAFILVEGEKIFEGPEAARRAVGMIRILRPFRPMMETAPVRWCSEIFYRLIGRITTRKKCCGQSRASR